MRFLTPIFVLGALVLFYCAFQRYQPLADLWPLIFLFLAGVFVLGMMLRDGGDEPVAPRFLVAAALPWIVAAFVVANAALDRSDEIVHQTEVVDISFQLRAPGDELAVRSWRTGRTNESLFLNHFRRRSDPLFHRGDPVAIGIKAGALGIPWISSVTHVARR